MSNQKVILKIRQKKSFVGIKLKKPIIVKSRNKIGFHFWSTIESGLVDNCDYQNPDYVQRQNQYFVLTNSHWTNSRLTDGCGSRHDLFTPVVCFDFLVYLRS